MLWPSLQERTVKRYYIELRHLLKLAYPVLIAQTAQTVISFIDTVMAGKFSALDMAAVAIAGSIWLPAILFGHGILLSLTPCIAHLHGARQQHKIAHQFWQGMWLAGLISLFLICFLKQSTIFIEQLSRFSPRHQLDPQLLALSTRYLHAILWGIPGYLLYLTLRCLCEGLAKTKPSMVVSCIGLLINIPINYLFIYGKLGFPALGGVGCGVATAIVYWVLFLLLLGYVLRDSQLRQLKLFAQFEWPHRSALWRLIKQGLPIGFSHFFEVTLFSIAALLIAPFGTEWVAGHQIALNFSSLTFMFPFSIGMVVTIRIGYHLGRGNSKRAQVAAYTSLGLGLFMAIASAIATFVLRNQIASLYSNDTIILQIAAQLMLFSAVYQCSDSIQVIADGILRGYNDTFAIFIITFISFWLVGFSCGCILGLSDWWTAMMGARGVWIGFIIGLTHAAILLLLRMSYIQKIYNQ